LYGSGISSLEYHQYVTKAFSSAFSRDVILKVVQIPSFHPESVLYLKKSKESYYILYLEAETHYWTVDRQVYKPNPIEKCSTVVSNSTAINIENAWVNELLNTRYSENTALGMDGTTYHFSTPFKWLSSNKPPRSEMSGQAWSPKKETRVGKLVNLMSAIENYCLNPNTEENIQKSIIHLTEK
jgi:hypothetical protein